jgi:hypothetical protein
VIFITEKEDIMLKFNYQYNMSGDYFHKNRLIYTNITVYVNSKCKITKNICITLQEIHKKWERGNSETWRYSSLLTHSPLTLPAQ